MHGGQALELVAVPPEGRGRGRIVGTSDELEQPCHTLIGHVQPAQPAYEFLAQLIIGHQIISVRRTCFPRKDHDVAVCGHVPVLFRIQSPQYLPHGPFGFGEAVKAVNVDVCCAGAVCANAFMQLSIALNKVHYAQSLQTGLAPIGLSAADLRPHAGHDFIQRTPVFKLARSGVYQDMVAASEYCRVGIVHRNASF